MWQRYPEPEDSIAATEGTAAHWAFEQLFAGQPIDAGLIAPNGVVLTDEMCDGAQLFYDTVHEELARSNPSGAEVHPLVEQTIPISRVHANNWGTPDFAAYFRDSRHVIHCIDYKFGHDYVDEYENWQLMDYVAGLIEWFGLRGEDDQHVVVHMVIVQPRCYLREPVRRVTVRASELRGHVNKLRMAAEAAHEPNPVATVNPKCKHCSGRHACEPYQRTALEAADLAMRSTPVDLTPMQTGAELAMLERAQAALEGRISGLKESAHSMIQRGERVRGYAIEYTKGRQAWGRPPQEIATLGDMFGVDLRKPALLTPKQAEKAGIPRELIDEYSFFPPGSPKLVPESTNELLKSFPTT
jgi:hypothetical protein